jgi:hypothetical protein
VRSRCKGCAPPATLPTKTWHSLWQPVRQVHRPTGPLFPMYRDAAALVHSTVSSCYTLSVTTHAYRVSLHCSRKEPRLLQPAGQQRQQSPRSPISTNSLSTGRQGRRLKLHKPAWQLRLGCCHCMACMGACMCCAAACLLPVTHPAGCALPSCCQRNAPCCSAAHNYEVRQHPAALRYLRGHVTHITTTRPCASAAITLPIQD